MALIGAGVGAIGGVLGSEASSRQRREEEREQQERRRAEFAADLRSRYPDYIRAMARLDAGEDCGTVRPDTPAP